MTVIMNGFCLLLAAWSSSTVLVGATTVGASTVTLCTALEPFVTELSNAAGIVGAQADCEPDGDWGATVDFDVSAGFVGTFGLDITMEPCLSSPSISLGATVSGVETELVSVVYGEKQAVSIPGLGSVVQLTVELSGTIAASTLELGLKVAGLTVFTLPGIDFDISAYECPACPYLADVVSTPASIADLPCPAIYAIGGGSLAVAVALLGVCCCACCKTCCFRPRHTNRTAHLLTTGHQVQSRQIQGPTYSQFQQQQGGGLSMNPVV